MTIAHPMRSILIIIFLLIRLSGSRAQDTLITRIPSTIKTRHENSGGAQHVLKSKTPVLSPPDTLNLLQPDLRAVQKMDSIKNLPQAQRSKTADITDSLQRIISLPSSKVNQRIATVQSHMDILARKINKPGEDVNKKLGEAQRKVQTKIESVQDKVTEKSGKVANKLQGGMHKATDGEMKLPDQNLTLGHENLNQIPGVDPSIPKVEVPGVDKLNPNGNLGGVKAFEKMTDIDLPEKDKLNEVSDAMNKIDGKLDEAAQYEGELKNIKENGLADSEKLPQELEAHVADVSGVEELSAASKKLAEQEAMIQRYKDKKLLQQEILRKSRNVVNDKLNKFSPAFKDAEARIARARKIKPTIGKMQEERKIRVNTMSGKPFRQRLVPGMTCQVYNGHRFNMDWAVQTGFKVSGLFIVGAGYTYRVNFGTDNASWIASQGVSGYRIYTNLILYKNVYAHAEFESLKLDRGKQNVLSETTMHVHGSNFGLGRSYAISHKIKGSVAALYRVNYKGEVPGISRVTLRIGFDYSLKKQRKNFAYPK